MKIIKFQDHHVEEVALIFSRFQKKAEVKMWRLKLKTPSGLKFKNEYIKSFLRNLMNQDNINLVFLDGDKVVGFLNFEKKSRDNLYLQIAFVDPCIAAQQNKPIRDEFKKTIHDFKNKLKFKKIYAHVYEREKISSYLKYLNRYFGASISKGKNFFHAIF